MKSGHDPVCWWVASHGDAGLFGGIVRLLDCWYLEAGNLCFGTVPLRIERSMINASCEIGSVLKFYIHKLKHVILKE